MITNTTYRFLVEKLGDSNPTQFVGNEGEVFYDPNNPLLKLSDGTTPGGVSVGGEGGGGNDSRISSTQISHWDTAYGWGDHSTVGYLTSFSETDPVFLASAAAGIGSTNISNWNTAYNWGDHSTAGYISSITAGSGISVDEVGGQVTIAATGAGSSTGDVTFSGNQVIGFGTGSGDGNGYSTLELVPDSNLYGNDQYVIVDPTAPSHIHLRAGGTQDSSNAQLFLGGEKNHVNVSDGTGVRLYNEETTQNTSFYSDVTDFTSATWVSDGSGGGYVEFTTTNPNLINGTFNAGDVEIVTVEQGTVAIVYTGATSLGGDVYRIYSQSAPSPDPQTVTNINITLYTTYQNEAYLQSGDFRVDVRDDVRIIGGDVVSLRNNSPTQPVTIISDNNNNSKSWEFNPNGTLRFPDNTIQVTGITSEKTTNWDAAYNWGDHSTAGYVSPNENVSFSGIVTATSAVVGLGTLSYTPTIETGIISAGNHTGSYAGITVQNNNTGNTSSANIYFSNSGAIETEDFAVIGLNGPNYDFGSNTLDGAKKLLYIANTDGDITLISNYFSPTGGNIHLGYGPYGEYAISVTNSGGISLGTTWDNTAQAYVMNPGTAGEVLMSGGEGQPATWSTIAAGIGSTNIDNWNAAYGWGDHSTVGYLETNADVVPATPTSTGTKGEVRYDGTHVYICVAEDIWIRSSIETTWS
jgi:hypothetical protein